MSAFRHTMNSGLDGKKGEKEDTLYMERYSFCHSMIEFIQHLQGIKGKNKYIGFPDTERGVLTVDGDASQ